jgi:hypothetical protein
VNRKLDHDCSTLREELSGTLFGYKARQSTFQMVPKPVLNRFTIPFKLGCEKIIKKDNERN